ncbi:MAG: nitronate monooxygenase, partial [Thermoplasmata archaeon]|nr:nitronate monooxygenase [Thermoplasmata archaeon]
ASRARVVEYFYEDPHPALVKAAHTGGALVSWQVGSSEEAIAAERSGCDFIVAQGTEAGGHVRGKIGLLALLSEVVPSVKIPVVAAGGIGTGRAMAAALAAGAGAVRVGTRFVAAVESEAHPRYVEKLIAAKARDTVLTEAFSTNWPNAPHRTLRASVEAMQQSTKEVVGERVYQWEPDKRVPVRRGDSFVPMASTTGDLDAMPFWAGESVDSVKKIQSAADIVQELSDEAEELLERWAKR